VTQGRSQNRRGEGARLRGDIVAAATALLEETGNEDAITLRGVARRVGIAAPSIYGHFDDVSSILMAVVADAFDELSAALHQAMEASGAVAGGGDPLRAVCGAYLDFARDQPHRYRVMFGRHRESAGSALMTEPRPANQLLGAEAFTTLVASVAAHSGAQPEADATTDATALWVALHGFASLQAAVPAFPWPDPAAMLNILLERLVPTEP
jgi:AcrR family transcriptional regulator